jgi:predicted DNA-binding protein YlxM (UPF0122 family)
MKIPTDVLGNNKIRDSKICSLYSTDAWTMEDIAKRFGITQQRVNQIIYKNRALLKIDTQYENVQQINRIKWRLKKQNEKASAKDPLDWEHLLDAKISDKKQGGGSGHYETKVIIIRPEASNGRVEDRADVVSRQISL